MQLQRFFRELKRRNVFRIATAYAIAGWLIIQICTSTFPYLNLPDWLITAVIVFVGIGFPISLIFAWAFELTPEGLKKSKEVDITASVTDRTGKKLNGIIITVLSMAVIFLLIERVFFAKASILEQENSSNIEMASIAVLPFVNMSSDAENEYFSDGLSEELLNGLAKIEDMQVAGRTSSFKFKGQNENLTEIGAELGVATILEGSVRKSGNQLRITAQLIRVSDGFHMWSETYDREFSANDIFNIQEEISRHVLEELKVRLLPEEEIQLTERPTQDIEAYNAFLEATQIEINRSPKDLDEAIQKYKDAIRIDPTFALAYARLAITYGLSFQYGYEYSDERRDEITALMRENIDQAQLLDNTLGKTFQALGMYFSLLREWEKSETAYERSIEILPNDAFAHNSYQIALSRNDKKEESYQILEKAYQLDPLNPVVANNYSKFLINIERDFDQGLAIIDQIINNYPDYMPIKVDKAWLLRDIPYGRQDEAFTYMFEAYKDDPKNIDFLRELTEIAMDVQLYPFAEHMIKEVEKTYPDIPFLSFILKRVYYSSKGEYTNLINTIDEIIETEENATRDNFRGLFYGINLIQGNYDAVISSIEEFRPELSFNEPIVADSSEFIAPFYLVALRKNGDDERADIISNQLCNDVPETIEDLGVGIDHSLLLVYQIRCFAFNREYENAIELTEQLYFEEKSKANWPLFLNTSPEYILMSEEPEFIALKERMLEDLHGMRANIIEFLKAEGEWREEWEISITN